MENIDAIENEYDSEDTEEESYDTDDQIKSDYLSDEHNILCNDKFYESHFK